jgi:crotonobetainyl-CoA:carnitine CoA-transferase CaiB-like acyl-CoA transferase
MILAIGNDRQFARFCGEAGRSELAQDPRFTTNRERVRHRAILIDALRQITVTRSTADWITALEPLAVPCGPINDIAGVFADPQVRARGMLHAARHEVLGEMPLVANPVNLSTSPVSYRDPPPQLGEHTDETLLQVLDMGIDEIDRLKAAGVIASLRSTGKNDEISKVRR